MAIDVFFDCPHNTALSFGGETMAQIPDFHCFIVFNINRCLVEFDIIVVLEGLGSGHPLAQLSPQIITMYIVYRL